jgi:hypothetical protein
MQETVLNTGYPGHHYFERCDDSRMHFYWHDLFRLNKGFPFPKSAGLTRSARCSTEMGIGVQAHDGTQLDR